MIKMSGFGRLKTLVICLDKLLASRIHKNFNSRNKITRKIGILMIYISLHGKNCIALYFSGFGA